MTGSLIRAVGTVTFKNHLGPLAIVGCGGATLFLSGSLLWSGGLALDEVGIGVMAAMVAIPPALSGWDALLHRLSVDNTIRRPEGWEAKPNVIACVAGFAMAALTALPAAFLHGRHTGHRVHVSFYPGLVATLTCLGAYYVVTEGILRRSLDHLPYLRDTGPGRVVRDLFAEAGARTSDDDDRKEKANRSINRLVSPTEPASDADADDEMPSPSRGRAKRVVPPLFVLVMSVFLLGAFAGVAAGHPIVRPAAVVNAIRAMDPFAGKSSAGNGNSSSSTIVPSSNPTSAEAPKGPSSSPGANQPSSGAPADSPPQTTGTPTSKCVSGVYGSLLSEFETIDSSIHDASRNAAAVATVLTNVGTNLTGCPDGTIRRSGNFVVVGLNLPGAAPFEVVVTDGGVATLIDPDAISGLASEISDPTLLGISGMWANASLTNTVNRRSFVYLLNYENGTTRLLVRTAPQQQFLLIPASVTDLATMLAPGQGYLTVNAVSALSYHVTVTGASGDIIKSDDITIHLPKLYATDTSGGKAYLASTSPEIESLLQVYAFGSNYMAYATQICNLGIYHNVCPGFP